MRKVSIRTKDCSRETHVSLHECELRTRFSQGSNARIHPQSTILDHERDYFFHSTYHSNVGGLHVGGEETVHGYESCCKRFCNTEAAAVLDDICLANFVSPRESGTVR